MIKTDEGYDYDYEKDGFNWNCIIDEAMVGHYQIGLKYCGKNFLLNYAERRPGKVDRDCIVLTSEDIFHEVLRVNANLDPEIIGEIIMKVITNLRV